MCFEKKNSFKRKDWVPAECNYFGHFSLLGYCVTKKRLKWASRGNTIFVALEIKDVQHLSRRHEHLLAKINNSVAVREAPQIFFSQSKRQR